MKKISIIIPCYNAGMHLADAVRSALAQTWPATEVVIVDDGSDEPEALPFLQPAERRSVLLVHQKNSGPAAARNRGIQEASGDYILPLDADDVLEPDYVAKAVAVLDAQPEVGIVYCRALKFGEDDHLWELPPYSSDELAIGNIIFVSAMFRKADWGAVGGFDETLRHGMEDYDFWIKLVHAGRKVVQLDEILFHCRVRARSRTSEFEEDRAQVVATYAAIFRKNRDFFAEHAESLFRHRFATYDELKALRNRLERESNDARTEFKALEAAKAEADRYNASLLSELQSTRLLYAKIQKRFRWLMPLWPRQNRNSR